MKLRFSLKLILWLWLGVVLILLALIIGAYSKLNPDAFLTMLNREVQRNYPGSVLTVKEINYSFKLDFSLKIKDLLIVSKNDRQIGRVGKVEIRLPWWLLLFNQGSAQINLSDLDLFVQSKKDSASLAKTLIPSSGKINVMVPDYIVDASYTLRAKNITVRDTDDDRRFFSLSKLLVRDFQYGKNSAFELNLPIRITHKNGRYRSELWLFGDVTPEPNAWVIKYRGELKTLESSEKIEFDDLVIDGNASVNPRKMLINSIFGLTVDKDTIGKGKFVYDAGDVVLFANFTKLPLLYLFLAGDEIRNPFWKGLDGSAEGEVNFQRRLGENQASTLSGKLNFTGQFKVPNGEEFPGNWQLNFENGKWETSFLSPKHEISFYRRAAVDFVKGSVTQYGQEIGFTEVDIALPLSVAPAIGIILDAPSHDYHSSYISIKKCKSFGKSVDGFIRSGILPDQRYFQVDLKEGESSLILNYQDKSGSHQLEGKFKNFQMSGQHRYLVPFLVLERGKLNGTIQGQWNNSWADGAWKSKLQFTNISRSEGELFDFWTKIANVFSIDLTQVQDFSVESNVNKRTVKLTGMVIEGPDPAVISGSLNTGPAKSQLTLNYPKNKKWKTVTKESELNLEKKENL